MEGQENVERDERSRLDLLDKRVTDLDSLVQEFMQWTKSQIGILSDKLGKIMEIWTFLWISEFCIVIY